MPKYCIRRAQAPVPVGQWNSAVWNEADTLDIAHFYDQSSAHRPPVKAKMLHSDLGLHVLFDVKDKYVICRNTEPQSSVCRDSCVEFFLEPVADKGYFNFEINCGGTLLVYYIEDPGNVPNELAKRIILPLEQLQQIDIHHSLPQVVFPERTEPTDWWLQAFVPWGFFEKHVGPLTPVAGSTWRGNFYKCADESSHPHWASWALLEDGLGFHKPQYFGTLNFE